MAFVQFDSNTPLLPSEYTKTYTVPTVSAYNTTYTVPTVSAYNTTYTVPTVSVNRNPLSTYTTKAYLTPPPFGLTAIIPGPYKDTLPGFVDLDKDPQIQDRMTKYFRFKTLDKWLFEEMSSILNFFKIENGQVKFTMKNNETYNNDQKETIINYIEHYILTEDTMRRILGEFVKQTGSHWYHLIKNEYFLKEHIEKKIKKILEKTFDDIKK